MIKSNKYLSVVALLYFLGITTVNGQIINIEDRRQQVDNEAIQDSLKWTGRFGVGTNLTSNISKTFSVGGNAQFERSIKRNLWMSISNYTLVKFNGGTFIHQGFQHFRYNYLINPKLTLEALTQAQFNKLANIDLRILTGTGLRYRLYKKEGDQGFLGATYLYEYEEEAIEDFTHCDHRLSTYFSFSWHPHKNVKIASTTYFQPLFKDFMDYRISTQSILIFSITRQFSFNVSISYVYDRQPAVGAPATLYHFINGLRFNF